MSKILCKIFRFLLNVFGQIVATVASAITILGDASVDVLSELLESAGDAVGGIFSGPGFLGLLVLGVVGYFVLTGDDDERNITTTV